MLLTDGTCKICPDYHILEAGGKSCKPHKCGYREKLLKNAECTKCLEYGTVTSDDLKKCVKTICDSRHKLNEDGSCSLCDDYLIVSGDGRTCIEPTCGKRDFVNKVGACVTCDLF